MGRFMYTIFDANPAQCGPCAWPDHEDVEVDAENLEEALSGAILVAETEGAVCGEYESGDSLWVSVWQDELLLVTREVQI